MKQQETAPKGPAIVRWIALFVVCCLCAAVACLAFAVAVGMAAAALLALLSGYVLKPDETRALICALSGRIDGFRQAFQTFAEAMRDIVHTMSETAKSFTQAESARDAASSAGKAPVQENAVQEGSSPKKSSQPCQDSQKSA